MNEPNWVDREYVLAIHDKVVQETGGAQGVRDMNMLESALAKPEMHFAYEKPDVFDLAALYATGIARNHPFVDGNKRTAFATAGLFLQRNGHELRVERDNEQQVLFERMAQGQVDHVELAQWYRENTNPIAPSAEAIILPAQASGARNYDGIRGQTALGSSSSATSSPQLTVGPSEKAIPPVEKTAPPPGKSAASSRVITKSRSGGTGNNL